MTIATVAMEVLAETLVVDNILPRRGAMKMASVMMID